MEIRHVENPILKDRIPIQTEYGIIYAKKDSLKSREKGKIKQDIEEIDIIDLIYNIPDVDF